MAVNLVEIETKCFQFSCHITQAHDLVVAAVDLQAVVVNDDGKVVQMIMGGSHESLPDLAFLTFSITQQREDLCVLAQFFGAQRHTNGNGAPLAQRTSGCVYARDLLTVRMALKNAVKLAEIVILAAGNKA